MGVIDILRKMCNMIQCNVCYFSRKAIQKAGMGPCHALHDLYKWYQIAQSVAYCIFFLMIPL